MQSHVLLRFQTHFNLKMRRNWRKRTGNSKEQFAVWGRPWIMLFNMPLSCISTKTFYLRKAARSSHRRCSTKKVLCVLTNLQNSQENTCARAWHSCFLQEYLFPEDFWATVSGQYVFFVHECSCKDKRISQFPLSISFWNQTHLKNNP